MSETSAHLPPTYKQMLEEMGKHIGQRKELLFGRSLLVSWPLMLFVVVGTVFKEVPALASLRSGSPVIFGVIFGIMMFLAIFYGFIVSFIFHIEKCIWIDSYFDHKNLEPKVTWSISKKLFWPGFRFSVRLAFRYYLIPIALYLIALGLFLTGIWTYMGLPADMPPGSPLFEPVGALLSGALIVGLCASALSYFMAAKTRYMWFLFLDRFGEYDSFGFFVKESKNLNQISKTETFRKSLVATFGTDVAKSISDEVGGVVGRGMAELGGIGDAAGKALVVYGKELNNQVASLGNLSAQYLLYRFARKELYGQEQQVNEILYNL